MAKKKKLDLASVDRKKLDQIIEKRSKIKLIAPSKLHPNPWNKNKMGKQYFDALKANIANPQIGFTQPVLVRKHPDFDDEFQIVDGEHRWKAATELGLERVPIMDLAELPEALAKYLMLEQNAVRGHTNDDDQKKILQEIEGELQELMADFDIWGGTVTEAPKDDETKYNIEDDTLDKTGEETTLIQLYLTPAQVAVFRKIIGQIRLARNVTQEAAVIECVEFFAENTGFGEAPNDN